MKKIFKKRILEIGSFGIVGGASTIVDWSVFSLLVVVLSINYRIGLITSYLCGAIINYVGNKKITFKSKNKNVPKQFSIFMGVVVVNLFISMGIIEIFVKIGLEKIISRILTTGIVFVLNYFAHKHITFKK